jgi:hypothetical protein
MRNGKYWVVLTGADRMEKPCFVKIHMIGPFRGVSDAIVLLKPSRVLIKRLYQSSAWSDDVTK